MLTDVLQADIDELEGKQQAGTQQVRPGPLWHHPLLEALGHPSTMSASSLMAMQHVQELCPEHWEVLFAPHQDKASLYVRRCLHTLCPGFCTAETAGPGRGSGTSRPAAGISASPGRRHA